MIIQHNISGMNSQRILGYVGLQKGMLAEKLSSGYRINRSADDAAGLAISEKMRWQIRGLRRASLNAQDGISLCQTADGALNEVHSMLQRLNELAVAAANGTNCEEDRAHLQREVKQLQEEIDKVASTTTFNEHVLFDGSLKHSATGQGTTTPKMKLPADIDVVVMEAVKASQTATGGVPGGSAEIKNLLKNELVPNAVSAILDTFPDTFGYLRGSEIGIGLEIVDNPSSSVLASVSSGTWFGSYMFYTLTVNTAHYTDDAEGRTELERTIGHEMMHALMSEALTSGMTGKDKDDNDIAGNQFPMWFIEGTAQLISGAFEPYNNWVNTGLFLNKDHDLDDIELRLNNNRLGSGTSASEYGTGYLAAMYLGHLVGGKNTLDPAAIADGIDVLLNTIRGGASLDEAINNLTSYNSTADFVNNFAKDAAPFVSEVLNSVGTGTGSLLNGKFNEQDLLADGANTDSSVSGLFALNTGSTIVLNDYTTYDPDHVMIEGGGATSAGVAGQDYVASTIPTPDAPDPDAPDPDAPDPDAPDPDAPDPDAPDPDAPGGGTGGTTNPDGTGGNTGGGTGTTPGTGGSVVAQGGIILQIGAEATSGNHMTIFLDGASSAILGIDQVDISTQDGASQAISQVRNAIQLVSTQRAQIGAYQNRLEHTIRNLDNVMENTTAAESRIRDTDMAKAMVEHSRYSILEQVAQSMLAQTNHQNESVLMLLQ